MLSLKYGTQPSKLLTNTDFDAMCQGGTVLEKDERGVKVIQLTNGDIFKIFRVKRLISGTNIYSYARRFCRNAARLTQRGIPTVTIKSLHHFDGGRNTGVLYTPLAGKTIRQLIQEDAVTTDLAERIGCFLAELHKKGVHFHSLHTGNVVQMPDRNLGLIDISDMSVYAWPLFCNTRVRSFKRWCKYQDDMNALGHMFWKSLQASYFKESDLSKVCTQKIKQANSQLITWLS